MHSHDAPLFVIERTRLHQYVVRNSRFPDVVQQRANLERFQILRAQPYLPANQPRKSADALRMLQCFQPLETQHFEQRGKLGSRVSA